MSLKKSLITAIMLSLIGLGAWETYWRSQGKLPSLDDNKHLWAIQRARLEKATTDDVVLLGSSRVLFDIQLNEWENETGKRPIMLASAGSTPLPMFRDIVDNTDFKGTIIVGVTSVLFFSTTYPKAEPWARAQNRIDHYYDRTYAERLNHALSVPLDQNFVFMSSSEEKWSDNIDLKTLLANIKVGNRLPEGMPPFNEFSTIALDRNTLMTNKAATDTAFANTVKKVWGFLGKVLPPPDKDPTMAYFVEDAKKFIAKGGNLILLRCPSSGGFRQGELMGTPRNEFWDELLKQTNVKGYHFEDYEQFKNLVCPEWSHLSATDAKYFTTELAKIMKKDKALTHPKTN